MSRGAVPGTMAVRPAGEPFLMVHYCRQTRLGTGEPDLSGYEIARTSGPRVPACPLDPRFTFSYRWVPNWAHIVLDDHTLCGASRMIERMSEAEQRRLQQMPVCPKCLARYPARLERLLGGQM